MYTIKYRAYHDNRAFGEQTPVNYRVELLLKDGAAGVTEIPIMGTNPVSIKTVNSSKDNAPIVVGSELVFTFKTETPSDFDSLFESEYKDWRIDYYNDDTDTLIWRGFIQPENLQRDVFEVWTQIEVSATDALKDLSEIDFVPDGKKTVIEAVKMALGGIDLDLDFAIKLNTYETTKAANELILSTVEVDTRRFARLKDGADDVDNCLVVLEKLLKPFNCTLRQQGGRYVIQNHAEGNSFYYLVNWSDLAVTARTAASDIVDIDSSKFTRAAVLSKINPVKQLDVFFRNRNLGESLVEGLNGFTEPTTPWNIFFSEYREVMDITEFGKLGLLVKLGNDVEEVSPEGDYVRYMELKTTFEVERITDNDFLLFSFDIECLNETGIWLNDAAKGMIVQLNITGPDPAAPIQRYVHGVVQNISSKLQILQTGQYSVRLEVILVDPDPVFSAEVLISNFDILRGVEIDGQIIQDISFDKLVRFDSVGKRTVEEELHFGDSGTSGDLGRFSFGSIGTLLWNRFGKTDLKPIIEIYAQNYCNARGAYADYLQIGVYDFNNELLPGNIITFDGKSYTVDSYDRQYNTGFTGLYLRELLTDDVSILVEYTDLTSVDGESRSGSSTVVVPTTSSVVLHAMNDPSHHRASLAADFGKIVRANPDNGRIEFGNEADPVFVAWRDADRAINQVYASPASGSPGVAGFRALVASDLADKIISYAKIQDVTALSVLGRASNTDGVIAPITAATDHHVLRRSGNTIGFGALTSANMPAYLPPASATTSQTLRYDGTNWVATDGLTVSAAGQVVTKRATNAYVGLITALTGAAGNVVAFEIAAHVAGGLACLNARDGLDLLFAVNNVEAFRIVNSNRRVGFGTPDPTRLLDVNGNLRVRTIADVRTVSSNHGAFLVARQSGTNVGDVDCIVANQSGLVRWTAGSGWSFDNAAYLTSFTETDPTVPSWVKAITEIQITNWGEAYSWGDHSLVGYIKGSVSSGYIPKANSLGVLENSKVFQDSSNNVGINTTDPSAQFHVASGTKPTSGSAYSTVAQEVSTTDTTDPYRVRYGFNMTADGANKEHSFAYLLATEGGSTQIPFVVHAKYFGIGAYTTSIGSTRFPTSKLSILLNSASATDTTESALKVSTNDGSPLDFHLQYKGHASSIFRRGYIISAPALRLATTVFVGASSTSVERMGRGTLNVGEMEVTEGSPLGWSLLVSGAAYIGNYSGSGYQSMSATGAQALNVRGAIKIDNSTVASYGSIRYTGSDYQGYMPNDGSGSPGWVSLTSGSGGGGTGAETFIALNDTPAAYSSAGQYVRINSGNNGLEFGALPTATTSVAGIVTVGSTLAVASGVINYNLPTATGSVLGGIKVGSRLTITDGVLSADVQIPSTLGGLSDVTITSPTNGQFLRYTDGVWYNVDFSGTGGSYVSWNIAASGTSGVASVSDAETVTFIAGTNIGITRAGREITINNAASVYSNWNLSASGTAGSEIISSGDNVLFQSGSNVTITRSGKTITISATAGGTGATTLAALDDVNIPSPSNGQVLAYDTTSSKWLATTLSGSYVLPVATSSVLGGIKIGYSASNQNIPVQLSSERAYVALTKTAIEHVLTGSIDTHNHPVATSSLLGMVKIGYTETGSKIPLSIHDDRGYVELTKSAIESVLTGAISSHSHDGTDVSIATVSSTESGNDEVFTLSMSVDKAYKLVAVKEEVLGEYSIIKLESLQTSLLRTVLVYIESDTLSGGVGTGESALKFMVGSTEIPNKCWRDGSPPKYGYDGAVLLVSVSNFGNSINDLALSYIYMYDAL